MKVPPESYWAGLPLGRGVTVLARDPNGLAALSKPVGVLSHPNSNKEEARALLTAPYDFEAECYEWQPSSTEDTADKSNAPHRIWHLNRLDSATSGVILVAADEALAATVRAQFKRKQVSKVYQALVFGKPKLASEIWRDRLDVKKSGGQIRIAPGHLPAECRMTLLRPAGRDFGGQGPLPVSLLRLEPMTGRSHQLRGQCAKRGLPIVGDQTYGDFRRNREFARASGSKRLFLHALETGFSYEFGGREFAFAARAPLPPEFEGGLEQA